MSFNLSADEQKIALPNDTQPLTLEFDLLQGQQVGKIVNLPAHGVYCGIC
jgi:hypothetical protein